jgi:SAM-dependent methyltransferase
MNEQIVAMKQGWNARAQEDARWYINTLSRAQTEAEFDASGLFEVQQQVLNCLPLLTGGRDPRALRLLEIGCGIGRMSRHLAEVFGEIVGVDVSGEMIRQAQARLAHLPNAHFSETNGVNFPQFPAASFDVIFSAYVFQHIPDAAIIAGNIADAFRLLKPGGVFKFVTSALDDAAYLKLPKDSWSGDTFPESRIRALAATLNAQLMGVVGDGTQYCWTLLRRRATSAPPVRQREPRLILCGQADDLALRQIHLGGERPYLTLALTGDFSEWDDAGNVVVQVGDAPYLPTYVGAPGDNVIEFMRRRAAWPDSDPLQINVKLTGALPPGNATVRVRLADAVTSDAGLIELV